MMGVHSARGAHSPVFNFMLCQSSLKCKVQSLKLEIQRNICNSFLKVSHKGMGTFTGQRGLGTETSFPRVFQSWEESVSSDYFAFGCVGVSQRVQLSLTSNRKCQVLCNARIHTISSSWPRSLPGHTANISAAAQAKHAVPLLNSIPSTAHHGLQRLSHTLLTFQTLLKTSAVISASLLSPQLHLSTGLFISSVMGLPQLYQFPGSELTILTNHWYSYSLSLFSESLSFSFL